MPFLALVLFASYTVCATAAEPSAEPSSKVDVQALVRHVDNLWRGTTSHADMTMIVKTQHYQRTMIWKPGLAVRKTRWSSSNRPSKTAASPR